MQTLVIDTNVIISAAITGKGNPAQIVKMVSDRKYQVCYNEHILAEYKSVLSRRRFMFSPEKQKTLINEIVEIGVVVNPSPSDIPMADESDRIFYDTAKEAGAILITGNTKHYPTEQFITTPAEFIKQINTKRPPAR